MSLELNYRIKRINWNIDQTSNGSFCRGAFPIHSKNELISI